MSADVTFFWWCSKHINPSFAGRNNSSIVQHEWCSVRWWAKTDEEIWVSWKGYSGEYLSECWHITNVHCRPLICVDSSHATWTRVGLESLFLWLVTWLGLAKKWLATWLGLAKKWLATWLGLAKKWLVTNASQKLLERPRDLIILLNSPRPKKVCFRFTPLPRKTRQNLPYLEFVEGMKFSPSFSFLSSFSSFFALLFFCKLQTARAQFGSVMVY